MIFFKEISEVLHKLITSKTGLVWEDTTYRNDECDSIWNDELDIKIMLPNEESFWFVLIEGDSRGERTYIEYHSITDMIEFIYRYDRIY